MATKANGKSPVSSASAENVMFFRDITLGPHETQLRFRLIHFWEAWNPVKRTLIGLEMLLIDKQGTVIQGFITPGRIEKFLSKMKRGSVYKLDNFYGTSNKSSYRVSEHAVTVSFSWNSDLAVLLDSTTPFEEDRFRFHSYEAFEANRDQKGDLYGTLGLTSMSSSRVFMEGDVQPTIEYLGCCSNPWVAEQVSAEVVTKREPLTIGELFSYMKQESAKEAFFECTATIDDVVHGSPWYYISCSGCHTKATKGPTSLMCTKCGKVNIAGVPQYRAKLSVYDNSAQAIFVLLGDAGCELTGKHASELVRSYFEVNGNKGDDHEVPVPEALISTIGQRHKFCVKVTEHNLSGKTRALTVTKILTLATPPVTESLEGNHNTAATEETFETGNDVREASQSRVDTSEGSKRSFDSAEIEGTKRPKCFCELGRGGIGVVYKTSLQDGRPVAVKKLTDSGLIKSQEEFEREMRKLGKLMHKNIVEIKGYYWTQSLHLLIYEFVSGEAYTDISTGTSAFA
ncbi:hypothetical protein Bca101_073665 [Brassica carinata]